MTLSYKIVQMNRELFQGTYTSSMWFVEKNLEKGSIFHKYQGTLYYCEEHFKSYCVNLLCVTFADFYMNMHFNGLLVFFFK